MKAIRIHEFGPTEDVLQYGDVPVPEPPTFGKIVLTI
jgi:NADPH:quinone reductase-like Zn-dependent oxidoreductase